jgi:ferredoxin-thioredoxin reductase catalytic subunit
MEGLQGKSKIIAEMVLFCLDNKRKIETIVTCYCQLALKKQELQKEL